MNNLPRLPRRRPRWQRVSIRITRSVGRKTATLAAGITLGFAAVAVADSVPGTAWGGIAHGLIVLAVIGAGAFAIWTVGRAIHRTRGRWNLSTRSQARNPWRRALGRGWRRG